MRELVKSLIIGVLTFTAVVLIVVGLGKGLLPILGIGFGLLVLSSLGQDR